LPKLSAILSVLKTEKTSDDRVRLSKLSLIVEPCFTSNGPKEIPNCNELKSFIVF